VRMGAQVRELESAEAIQAGDVVLLGLCNEQGVVANGGRPGTAQGPAAFRRAFFRLDPACLGGRRLLDAGDVAADAAYGTYFEAAEAVVSACVAKGALPLVIGGGHDCSYGSFLGLLRAGGCPPGVVAVDAHLDMRPTHGPSSGNPFYRMLERGLPGPQLAQVGLVPWVNEAAHRAYGAAKGVELRFLEPGGNRPEAQLEEALGRLASLDLPILATLDLDAIGAPWAPGVSAVNPWGLSADAVLAMAFSLGKCPRVACLDLMELAPGLDPDGRTARLAAFVAAAFLDGTLQRPE
jgi:formiminoglutamase